MTTIMANYDREENSRMLDFLKSGSRIPLLSRAGVVNALMSWVSFYSRSGVVVSGLQLKITDFDQMNGMINHID